MRTRILLTAVAVAVLGCSADTAGPSPDDPTFARGGPKAGPSDPTATWLIPLDDAGLAFRSDGQFGDGEYSVYANGVCGVAAKIYATTAASNSGDATIQTDAPKGKNGCGRTFTLDYPDGTSEAHRGFNNLRLLQNTETIIQIGDTEKRTLAIGLGAQNSPSRCGRLLFGVGRLGNGVGSDSVLVTRMDGRTWEVQSQAAPDNKALCEDTGEIFVMPVHFSIVASEDLP